MSNNDSIKVFLRVRPSKRPSGYFEFDEEHHEVVFNVPVEEEAGGYINNTRTRYEFKFDGLLGMETEQDRVFESVARDAVASALEGYNATVFAYGQTGSGKTFTITGGPEKYEDRGIIPRALSHIFQAIKDRKDYHHTVYISYLEIYNESGYDLLDPSHDFKSIHDLPRVTTQEDEEGNVHLRGLSMHLADDEEEALNYLFLGDTNRAICETPMNPVSSRSHCIFTISLESRQEGSAVIRRSKLHLVDLAGSERVHKTHSEGQIFREATHINRSLHFLEMVIVALHNRVTKHNARLHVPYRNSMLTSVLRDSLGGNSLTTMVATVNPEKEETGESLSTCRFAQRVARIRNDAIVNVETDPNVLVRQLRSQVQELERETAFLRGEAGEGEELDEDALEAIREACRAWVAGTAPGETPDIGEWTLRRLRAALVALRDIARSGDGGDGGGGAQGGGDPHDAAEYDALREENQKLRHQLQQRDSEIAILVNMVKESKAEMRKLGFSGAITSNGDATPSDADASAGAGGRESQSNQSSGDPNHVMLQGQRVPAEVLRNKDEAFALFRSRHPKTAELEEHKESLRRKYAEAKREGARVNEARNAVSRWKSEMEQLRARRAVADAVADEEGRPTDATAEEQRAWEDSEAELVRRIEEQKAEYKQAFQSLRDLKSDIEYTQKLLEAGRVRLQADFENWYSNALLRSSGSTARQDDTSGAAAAAASAPRSDASASSSVPKTGQRDVDADIQAFYEAKERLQSRRRGD